MKKHMKKLLLLGLMTFGAVVGTKTQASAHDYVSSTWTAQLVAYVTTITPSGLSVATISAISGGVTAGGGFDLQRVWVSSGYNNGAYFVCVDSLPLTAASGGASSAYSFANFPSEQVLFPPMTFLPSTATVTNNTGIQGVDFRDIQGGGKTVKNGLTCFIVGDTTNKYIWQLETVETPSASERR